MYHVQAKCVINFPNKSNNTIVPCVCVCVCVQGSIMCDLIVQASIQLKSAPASFLARMRVSAYTGLIHQLSA